MFKYLKFWNLFKRVNKVLPKKNPSLILEYDMDTDTAFATMDWPSNINKSKFYEYWPLILFSFQTGVFNPMIIEAMQSQGISTNSKEFCDSLVNKLNEYFSNQKSRFMSEQLIFPDEVFHVKNQ